MIYHWFFWIYSVIKNVYLCVFFVLLPIQKHQPNRIIVDALGVFHHFIDFLNRYHYQRIPSITFRLHILIGSHKYEDKNWLKKFFDNGIYSGWNTQSSSRIIRLDWYFWIRNSTKKTHKYTFFMTLYIQKNQWYIKIWKLH